MFGPEVIMQVMLAANPGHESDSHGTWLQRPHVVQCGEKGQRVKRPELILGTQDGAIGTHLRQFQDRHDSCCGGHQACNSARFSAEHQIMVHQSSRHSLGFPAWPHRKSFDVPAVACSAENLAGITTDHTSTKVSHATWLLAQLDNQ